MTKYVVTYRKPIALFGGLVCDCEDHVLSRPEAEKRAAATGGEIFSVGPTGQRLPVRDRIFQGPKPTKRARGAK